MGEQSGAEWWCSEQRLRLSRNPALISLLPGEDLGDASVADAQLPRDDARTHPRRRHLDDLEKVARTYNAPTMFQVPKR